MEEVREGKPIMHDLGLDTRLNLPKYEAGVIIPVISHYRDGQIEMQREDVACLKSYCEGVAKAVSV